MLALWNTTPKLQHCEMKKGATTSNSALAQNLKLQHCEMKKGATT